MIIDQPLLVILISHVKLRRASARLHWFSRSGCAGSPILYVVAAAGRFSGDDGFGIWAWWVRTRAQAPVCPTYDTYIPDVGGRNIHLPRLCVATEVTNG
jgi:hypothetical protein